MQIHRFLLLIPLLLCTENALAAQLDNFKTGPVFNDFGPTAPVQQTEPLPANTVFKLAFDVAKAAEPGKLNRSIESAARFINMHVAAGVPLENIQLAVVVHGSASLEMTNPKFYAANKDGLKNSSATAIAQLQEKGVKFYLCGQSAAAYGISNADLLPGVNMALSAMTAHVLLQQQGFAINPF
ncbi:DsrE family protein [Alishewanella sp. SMS8]|uniref:DsrE family protein n=1 Tax=unclassified Alishewanella TaxID=2628974 RepID=UPI0027427FD4|nr:DsrE family protein [Alishewanella sp. SMS8]MDP4945013.1 DsrE family protein [Alishewanella sp.]MDP5036669.1 DsrE family protein [Alishewanella sp.]MDP5187595.1 DsrE family protein [Alishewanella sp.]MDP5458242.1 DsrE family protein [Alishewanella sp. SMS8]